MTQSIAEWLDRLGLSQYCDAFLENDIDLEILPDLAEDDLRELGLTSMGHRKKLLRAIDDLRVSSTGEYNQQTTNALSVSETLAVQATERRQLTVLFCDLVGSTAMAGRLDPEDLRELLRRFQETVSEKVRQKGGHVAKFLGDGVLVYFGWPQAFEDQAHRALQAALGVLEAVGQLGAFGETLQIRVGIASGLVVVGELAGESDAITGETANLAARLQGLAAPGELLIDSVTRDLVGGAFELEALEAASLKGFDEPVVPYRVLASKTGATRFDLAQAKSLTPLVGRASEKGLLIDRWRQAVEGEGQVVLLSGDAGIGKSRLVSSLREEISREASTTLSFQCAPHHEDSAFHPIIQQLSIAANIGGSDDSAVRKEKLRALLGCSDGDLRAVLPLLGESTQYEGQAPIDGQAMKVKAMEALLNFWLRLSSRQPLLIVVEDLHWIDPSSQDLVGRLAAALVGHPILAVLTHRPEYKFPISSASRVTALSLSNLRRSDVAAIIDSVAGDLLDQSTRDQIFRRADGIPLFVEEMARSVAEVKALRGSSGLEGEVPATLQASLLARLDRLGRAKELAQVGSVIGREFSFELLRHLAKRDENALLEELETLVSSDLVFQSGSPPQAHYQFKHALVQDAAYGSLLRRRREELHGAIADVIEREFPRRAQSEPAMLARHHSLAGNHALALDFWEKAGDQASALFSGREATKHFEQALALFTDHGFDDLEPNERDATKLRLELGLARALQMTSDGPADPKVGEAFRRALALAEGPQRIAERAAAIYGLYRHNYWHRGPRFALTNDGGLEALVEVTESQSDSVLYNYFVGTARMATGDEVSALGMLEEARHIFQSSSKRGLHYTIGHNQGISSLLILAWCAGSLGSPNRARQAISKCIEEAEQLGDPLTIVIVRLMGACVMEDQGEVPDPESLAVASAHCQRYGFAAWAAFGRTLEASIAHHEGQGHKAIELIDSGIKDWFAAGFRAFAVVRLAKQAEICLDLGETQDAERVLDQATTLLVETGEVFWETEILRQKARLLALQENGAAAAKALLREALTKSNARQARSFSLRLAMDLARLDSARMEIDGGKSQGASTPLKKLLGEFAVDEKSPDLVKARALLANLGSV